MRLKLIRLGSLITLYNGIYAIIYGFLVIFFSRIILGEYFRKIPVTWSLFKQSFPYRASLYFYLLMSLAFFIIAFGIFIIYLSYFILKRKDKLAWAVLFMSGIIGWASLFIINLILGAWTVLALSSIGWVSFVLGMLIPIKYYLQKEYPEF